MGCQLILTWDSGGQTSLPALLDGQRNEPSQPKRRRHDRSQPIFLLHPLLDSFQRHAQQNTGDRPPSPASGPHDASMGQKPTGTHGKMISVIRDL